MLQLGEHCSLTERRADEATRDVADWLKCDFMLDQIGQQFTGIITSVTGFGFFVRLNDLFIDGLVHVSTLNNDYYQFDNVGQRLIGESSGQVYRLGDEVEVKVEAVSMDERTIDFSLISTTRKARNPGKTARVRALKGEKTRKMRAVVSLVVVMPAKTKTLNLIVPLEKVNQVKKNRVKIKSLKRKLRRTRRVLNAKKPLHKPKR